MVYSVTEIWGLIKRKKSHLWSDISTEKVKLLVNMHKPDVWCANFLYVVEKFHIESFFFFLKYFEVWGGGVGLAVFFHGFVCSFPPFSITTLSKTSGFHKLKMSMETYAAILLAVESSVVSKCALKELYPVTLSKSLILFCFKKKYKILPTFPWGISFVNLYSHPI